ncbi:MAG: hypothetical protein NZ898_03515 [Myxococcota bacterium]|nr:hypothetical protein [Myxococcota bacterium]MDW8361176.1 hypothetical protein [Myxococcales bacterium]
MRGFVAGFAVSSLLWVGGIAIGMLWREDRSSPEAATTAPTTTSTPDAGAEELPSRKRRRRHVRGATRPATTAAARPTSRDGPASTGDDLGEQEARSLDLGASSGEEQLTTDEIDRVVDTSFGRIRRCLVLAAGDEPVHGELILGMRIEPSGSVSRVNLSGPAAVVRGEAGECLRATVRSLRWRSFDGPPMVVRYPIYLD